jgi:YbbR domain-containing protein
VEFIKRYILSNARLKILSLVLAFMLWFATTYLGESHVSMTIPVQLVNLNRTCITRTLDTKEVLVTLNGPLWLLKNLKPGEVNLVIDLSKAREGRQIVTVRKSDIVVPKGIKVEEVRPDYVVLEVDRTVEKYLRIIVKLDENVAGKYRIVSWSPQQALVEGARQALEDKEVIETIPISRDSLRNGEVIEAPLNSKDLCTKKVRPEAVKVVLKRIGK